MENKNISLFWSGGTQCSLALTEFLQKGYKIQNLITLISKKSNEVPLHGAPDILIKSQAKYLGIPNLRVYIEDQIDNTQQGAADATLAILAKKYSNLFAFGAKNYVSDILDTKNYEFLFPDNSISHKESLLKFLETGHRGIITAVDEAIMPLRFLGREIDHQLINEIEIYPKEAFQTFTTFGPTFKMRVAYSKSITVTSGRYTIVRLREA